MKYACPVILTDGPRAGQPCGRRFMAPNDACQNHRPPPPSRQRPPSREDQRKVRTKRQREKATAGIPSGWVV
jgi:hypothetical protein